MARSSTKISLRNDGHTFVVTGNITPYTVGMIPKQKTEDCATCIETIMRKCHPVMPHYINWENLTNKEVIFCIRPDNGQYYLFDLSNKDNVKNDYLIPKIGIYHFHDNKYNIYMN